VTVCSGGCVMCDSVQWRGVCVKVQWRGVSDCVVAIRKEGV